MNNVADDRRTALAARLRELRKGAGLTQREVAERLGIGYQTYMRWERGETEPSFAEVCELAEMFGKTPNDFQPERADP